LRDARRRTLGQNFLADPRAVARFIAAASISPGDLVVEPGAGRGALTIPLANAGADVIAFEKDTVWAKQLSANVAASGLEDRVRVFATDFMTSDLPATRYRIVANPSFGSTTALLDRLLDNPGDGPWRADLVVQREVAVKRSAIPATTLRSAAWAPWWEFELGPTIARTAFRPIPSVDAAVLSIRRRNPPLLPERLAPKMRSILRRAWNPQQS
jgi:23S rRNA (adenine-N6)-dimethyltransferase